MPYDEEQHELEHDRDERDDSLVGEQEGKGYGSDPGERERALEEDANAS